MALCIIWCSLLLTSGVMAQTSMNRDGKLNKITISESEPVIVAPSSIIAFPGEAVSFKCQYEEGAGFSWWFGGQPIVNRALLQLTNISASNAGQYICRAKHPQTGETKKAYASLTIPDQSCVSEWLYRRPEDRNFYHARWWPDKQGSHVYFDLMARTQLTHWIGVGFSQERMPVENDDILVGWIEGDRFTVQDRHFSSDAKPLLDSDQSGLTLLSGTHRNGITRIQFMRRLNMADPQDASLDLCQFFLHAWKGKVITRKNITQQKHLFVSDTKICPLDCLNGNQTVSPLKQGESVLPPRVTAPAADILSGVGNTVLIPFKVSYDGLCPNITLYNNTTPIAVVNSNSNSVLDRVTIWCNGTVLIKRVDCYDSGSFILVAKSEEGVADATVVLHVVSAVASSSSVPTHVTKRSRLVAELKMTVSGSLIYWMKNGEFVLPTDRITFVGNVLRVTFVNYMDKGVYRLCARNISHNTCGAVCQEFELIVLEFPRVFVYTSHSVVESYKQRYCSITCITRGYPKPVIYWTKNGRLLNLKHLLWNPVTGQLVIPCYTRDDTALYRCLATRTGLGTDSKAVPITVVESDNDEAPTVASIYQFYQSEEGGRQWQALEFRFRVRLAIVNNYDSPIELWWINYVGQPDRLVTVQPNDTYFMYTYRSHPILARNKENGHWLTMNGQFPFFPNPVWQETIKVCDPYPDDPIGQSETVSAFRSLALMHKVYVRFVNFSPRVVHLIWLGLDGTTKVYHTMKPYAQKSMYTYEGHLWVSRDARSGENMLIGGRLVFTAPATEYLDVVITEAKTCHLKPPRVVIQRETFFIFGCDGMYVVDAEQAQVTKFVKANTTVVVGDDSSILCRNSRVDMPSQGKTADWKLNGFAEQTSSCHVCRWGQPARACNRFIYVPEMATKRVYIIDVVTEEVVESIQLDVVPYKVHFYHSKNLSQIWIQTLGIPSFVVVENPCEMDDIEVANVEDISNTPAGHMSMLHHSGLRGSHNTALVWSHSNPLIAELNLQSYYFGQTETDMSVYGCQSTTGWAFSSLNGHALTSCYKKVGDCPLLELNTLTMEVIHSNPMKTCGLSHASPDGQYVVTIPFYNASASPDVVVHRVATSSGEKSMHICTVPINDTVGNHFASDVVFVGKPEGWKVYLTFKDLKVLAKVDLSDCRSVHVVGGVGRMIRNKRKSRIPLAGWAYQRRITMVGQHVGQYLATPAQSQDIVAVIDMNDDSVRLVKKIDGPYHVIGGGRAI